MLKIKKIKPLFTSIVTTMDAYEEGELNYDGLIDSEKTSGTIKDYQTVLAVGPSVLDINVGDIVAINFARYTVVEHKKGSLIDGIVQDNPTVNYNFNIVNIDDKQCLYLQNNDILFVIEEYE